jgi:adenylate cyclase
VSSEVVRDANEGSFFRSALEYTTGFENRFYDFRMRTNIDPKYKSKEIVLINIDDYSLSKLGIFPLPRTVWADLLKKLDTYDAKVVAFDVMFPEKSPSTEKSNPDAILARAFHDFQKNGKRVFISYNIYEKGMLPKDQVIEQAPIEILSDLVNTQSTAPMERMVISAFTYPIEELTASEVGLGFISMVPDPDGIFRKYQLIANIEGDYIGSLGFNAYEAWVGKKNFVKISQTSGGEVTGELELDSDHKLIIDEQGQTPIRFKGQEQQFPNISLYDVLEGKNDDPRMKALFAGKLVFVGSTAEGAHDLRPTPLDVKTPGVYAHINFAQMLISKYLYAPENDSLKLSIALLILGLVIFILVHRFDNALVDLLVIASMMGSSYYIDKIYFLPHGYQLKLFYCYLCFVLTYSWNTFLNFYEASKEKRQIKGTFARYVAPTVVEEMLKDPENIQVGGKRMDITCLFSDVRDFTSISEGLSAQDLANMLNTYMNAMTDIVFETMGTLDKYIGDAIVAIWGAPLPIGNHAQFAVEAAIRMTEAMPAINEEFKSKGLPYFNVGIGLNTGECSVGNMGSTRIFSYTALGDNMNLGARLEGLCKYYGAQILISQNTLDRIDTQIVRTRPVDKVIVKGRTQAVGIYEVISKVHYMGKEPETLQFYLSGWQFFTHRNFRAALDVFSQILTSHPEDKVTKRLKLLCEKYLADPALVTDDFDVTKMMEK